MKEDNILFVKENFLHGVLRETYVVMVGRDPADTRWYRHWMGDRAPATVHRFCEKRKAEVFTDDEKLDLRVLMYRK